MQHHNDLAVITALSMVNSQIARETQALKGLQAAQTPRNPPVNQQVIAETASRPVPMPVPGLAALQAPNMETIADGGIAGYADGGAVAQQDMQPGAFTFAQHSEPVLRMANGTKPIQQYVSLIRAEAERLNLDPDMAVRLFMTESGGNPNAVSPKGAVGLGQLMPDAAKEMGLRKEERTDPVKNIRASLGYLSKQMQKYKDPEKAAAAYNWGPANLDKHLARNDGQLNKASLPKETADYLAKVQPVSFAATTEQKAAGAAKQDAAAQIPTRSGAPQRAVTPELPEAAPTLSERLFGAGETAASLATGLAAIPLGGARKLAEQVMYGRSAPIQQYMEDLTFAPRGETGREYVQNVAKTAQDLKIPPYIPAVTSLMPGVRQAGEMGRAGARAETAAAEAAQTAAPRLPRTPVSSTKEPLTAVEQARQAAELAKQREAVAAATRTSAAAQQEAAAANVAKSNIAADAADVAAAGARATIPSAFDLAARTAANAPPSEATFRAPAAPVVSPDDEYYRREETFRWMDKDTKKDLIDAAKKEAPEGKKEGWTNEDWLQLGFALLANKSPYLGEAVGTAGLKTLAAKQERKKEAREDVYRRALARKATAEAQAVESGVGTVAKAVAYADKEFDNWLNSVKANPVLQMQLTPEAIEAQRQKYLQEAYKLYKIEPPAGSTVTPTDTAFTVLGSRPG